MGCVVDEEMVVSILLVVVVKAIFDDRWRANIYMHSVLSVHVVTLIKAPQLYSGC